MSKIKDTRPIEHQSELQKTIWNRHVERVLLTFEESSGDITYAANRLRMDVESVQKILDQYKK